MCGIWGVVMTPESKEREQWTPTELAQLMFPAIRHRGPHAFGWMTWDGNEEVEIVKCDGDVGLNGNLAQVELADNAMWMVGHVRYATHGSTSELSNNHPIIHGEVIGVHNGVLRNHEKILAETGREDDITEVDSEAIFAAVNRWGHRAGLRRIEGDMVAVYTKTSKPENLWIARTRGRDLVIARTLAGSLVFASELGVLESVFGAANLTHVRNLKRNQLLRIRDGKVVENDTIAVATAPVAISKSEFFGSRGVIATKADKRAEMRKHPHPVKGITDRMMKPKGQARITEPIRFATTGANGSEAAPGLYWHNGQLLTEQEYIDVMEQGF